LLDDAFAIQTDIAKRMVGALQVTLQPGEGELLERGGTRNAQAYDFFLQGQEQLRAYGDGTEAAEMFRKALAFDADFAQAHAGLASALSLRGPSHLDMKPAELEEAFTASRRALELEPRMPEAYLARAQLMSMQGRNEDALRDFEETIRLSPTSYFPYYAFGRHCLGTGQAERAVELFQTAARLAPDEYTPQGMLSFALQKLGRSDEEREARIEALRLLEGHLQRFPEDEAALSRAAIMEAWLGRTANALTFIERTVRARPNGFTGLYNAACACAVLGDRNRAIELLERAVQNGRGQLGWLENDEDLANLHGDPRFTAIMDRIRTASAQV
jgi:adenylate cyclase